MAKLEKLHYKEQFSVFGDPDAQDPDPEVRKRFFGKYQGSVVNNVDPLRQGRLQVRVPDVTGQFTSTWAMPCVPMAGPLAGTFVPPPVGAGVWVEFEQGDPQTPIWVGCFWGPGQIPPLAQAAATAAPERPVITLETNSSGVSVCDVPLPPGGTVNLHAGTNTFITLGMDGITITAPSVKIATPSFTINGAAFSVGAG
jgi:hypothetical protein